MENDIEERSSLESVTEYLQLIWRWAWLMLLATVITGVIFYYFADRQPRIYEATTSVEVRGGTNSVYNTDYSSNFQGQTLAQTYSKTMATRSIKAAASERLGYPITAGIQITPIEFQPIIEIRVTDTDPQRAADVANTLVAVFSEKVISDQALKYAGLKTNLENQIADIDKELEVINGKLAVLSIKFSEIEAAQRKNAALEAVGVTPTTTAEKDPADIVEQTQLQFSQSQYQSTRFSLFSNLQQVKLSELQSTTTINQLDPAIVNPIPIQPQPLRSALLAAMVGLMVSAGVIFLAAFLQDTIHDPEEITRRWGIPVLGIIAHHNTTQNQVITINQPRVPIAEAYRSLRTNLQFAGVNKPLKTIMVTSASPSDGKTSVVANLAAVIAQNDKEVVVIDSDLRRPRMHKLFNLSNRLGLSDCFIQSEDRLEGLVKKTGTRGLYVITSGSIPPNPSELLSSEKMTEMVTTLTKYYNTVIIDTPPLLAVTDALVLAPRVDGVILVMDPHRTKRAAIKHAIDQLQRVNANLLGVVLNKVKAKNSTYYYSREYYYGNQENRTPLEFAGISRAQKKAKRFFGK